MCDTMVALPAANLLPGTLFGKNSDRQRNEAQGVELLAGSDHEPGQTLRCTYLQIPQARRTQAVLLCRPYWMWGAEMGANESGVAIGNEGLHSREAPPQTPALTGMDLVRLGLERSASAGEALEIMTALLSRFGQGGNCGHRTPAFYNNSFLIADPQEAFVLETVGKDWVAERVGDVRAISNHYGIKAASEAQSAGFTRLAARFAKECEPGASLDEILADSATEHIGQSRLRSSGADAALRQHKGELEPRHFRALLRDHRESAQTQPWDPRTASSFGLCIHAGQYDAQTTGSMVSKLEPARSVHWVTGTSSPCLSIFKPIIIGVPLPEAEPWPIGQYDPACSWWRHERFLRAAVEADLPHILAQVAPERDALECAFDERLAAAGDDGPAIAEVVQRCWSDARALERSWEERFIRPALAAAKPNQDDYARGWTEMNVLAGIPRLSAERHP